MYPKSRKDTLLTRQRGWTHKNYAVNITYKMHSTGKVSEGDFRGMTKSNVRISGTPKLLRK